MSFEDSNIDPGRFPCINLTADKFSNDAPLVVGFDSTLIAGFALVSWVNSMSLLSVGLRKGKEPKRSIVQ